MNSLRVAIILPEFLPVPATKGGGVESLVTGFLDQNERQHLFDFDIYSVEDHEARAECLQYNYSNFFFFKLKENRIKNLPLRILRKIFKQTFIFNIDYFMRIIRMIGRQHYDCVIVENKTMLLPLLRKMLPDETKIFVHIHNVDQIKPNFLIHLEKQADAVITVSDYVKKCIVKAYPSIVENTIFVVHNFVNSEQFKRNEISGELIRSEFGINNKEKVVLYSGRIIESKGVEVLLNALIKLNMKDVHLVVVGSSWYGEREKNSFELKLEKLASEMKTKVIFTGFIPHQEMNKYYSAADVCVFPSIAPETAGLVQIESMDCGCMTIISNSGGMPEYMSKNGIIINLNSDFEKNLFKALSDLLSTGRNNLKIKGKCLRKHAKKFSQENSFNELKRVLKYSE